MSLAVLFIIGLYLLMVSLESNQLILQGLQLRFQGRSNQSQVIHEISQAIDVSLHGLTDDQLILIPVSHTEKEKWGNEILTVNSTHLCKISIPVKQDDSVIPPRADLPCLPR